MKHETPSPDAPSNPAVHDAIAHRAYELWEQDGKGHGSHERHWRDAEHQLVGTPPAAELHPQPESPAPDETAKDVPHFPPTEAGHPVKRPD
jgi:hypothetical protein